MTSTPTIPTLIADWQAINAAWIDPDKDQPAHDAWCDASAAIEQQLVAIVPASTAEALALAEFTRTLAEGFMLNEAVVKGLGSLVAFLRGPAQ